MLLSGIWLITDIVIHSPLFSLLYIGNFFVKKYNLQNVYSMGTFQQLLLLQYDI